jgi:hypothetical protein
MRELMSVMLLLLLPPNCSCPGHGVPHAQHWQRVRRLSFHSNSYPDDCSDFLT